MVTRNVGMARMKAKVASRSSSAPARRAYRSPSGVLFKSMSHLEIQPSFLLVVSLPNGRVEYDAPASLRHKNVRNQE